MELNQSSSKLMQLMELLKNKQNKFAINNYTVPDLWNTWGYNGVEMVKTKKGELNVNPYNFYYEVISSCILPKKKNDVDYSLPLNQMIVDSNSSYLGGDWIKDSVVYSMMIRTSTAWDHDRSGKLESENLYGLKETGTFVKTMAILPLLKKMGVDVVYLLPISKFSLKDKKGELGSPYGVSNFYELDPNLKDPMTGDEFTTEDEFQAFVEACHILDMKVMIDIIPRTNSVENDLIINHPEWFYWIKSAEFTNYLPPRVPSLGNTVAPILEVLSEVYQSKDVWKHIRKFSYDPKTLEPQKYEKLVNEYKQNSNISVTDLIKREFQIQIAPAFSDQINDPQPPWTDITFFRMYEDHPILTQQELSKYLKTDEEIPPYILFDTIKCNFYQGNKPNKALWNTLSGVIPYYQKHFGIDGARIDMGHALSTDLLEMIISRAREIDANFCFVAEELNTENANKARKLGYNMIIGDGFSHEPRFKERKLHEFMSNASIHSCPIFACGETHDTPRLAARDGGRTLANMLTMLNMFVPNAVPFINSGQEVYERQPINTGLDVGEDAIYMLDPSDPFYMKLALFDKYAFHYLNEGHWEIPNQLEKVAKIRKTYQTTLSNLDNFMPIEFTVADANCIGFAYLEENKRNNNRDNVLFIFANTDPFNETHITANIEPIRTLTSNVANEATLLFSQHEHNKQQILVNEQLFNLDLKPGEVQVIKL